MLKKLGFIMVALLMLAGCGSDDGVMMPLYTSATLKISLPTYARDIIGTDFTINLPAGVTPALEADGTTVAAGVVTPSGTFSAANGGSLALPASYTPGKLTISLQNSTTPGVAQGGEVATVVREALRLYDTYRRLLCHNRWYGY